ncbi:ATP-binding protein [Campylobacter mucosalis]|uniref:ATP-binding protein n=1 Tax=Campylobacter mucosalis TaxID=202 RepID=UPI00147050EC|nr:ATP-binding protein [Campylobacter mucosalis]
MQELELLYELALKNVKFTNRKYFISANKTLLIGATGSGKTSLICEYLSNFKPTQRLYIDLNDLRVKRAKILQNLKEFLQSKTEIQVLCVENVNADELGFLQDITTQNIIISTTQKHIKIDGFATINLPYLDYEEFISFFKKNLDPDMLFSYFLAHGGAVKSSLIDATEVPQSLANNLKKELNEIELAVIKECVLRCNEQVSVFEIYKSLKEQIKISKDSVYTIFNKLENIGLISNISRLKEPNASKKLYLNDFALRSALCLKKDFANTFANVVFCELLKFKDEICYTKELEFVLLQRKLAIVCMPFTATEIALLKFKKLHSTLKELGVTRLHAISVTNSANLSIEGIRYELIPFSRWALGI